MDFQKVDLIIQYALAVAGEAESYEDRELGPIHLLKFVYLGDLAFAQEGAGTFTRASWCFYKFGPWSNAVHERIQPATRGIHAVERRFTSRFKEDGVRWRISDAELADALEVKLPWSVARAVKSAVRQYGNDTAGLLHHVYRTPPMLKAAPGELLDFDTRIESQREELVAAAMSLPILSKTKVKQLQALVKNRLQEKLGSETFVTPEPSPRYDEIFAMGQEWLDGLAGEPIKVQRGHITFSESVWKSPGRRDPEIP